MEFDEFRLRRAPLVMRMNEFICGQGSIPQDILFAGGPRVSGGQGFRWVPHTYSDCAKAEASARGIGVYKAWRERNELGEYRDV